VVVHPSAGHESGTLVHAIIAHTDDLSGIGGEGRPGIVHRLDKDTTGLLAIAKNDEAHRSLQDQIQARTAVRVYRGIVWGSPRFDRATIEASVGRHPTDRKRMTVLPDGAPGARHAVTHLTVAARRGPFAEIEARLETGRTHQIRVHCSYIGHPVVADTTYGGDRRWPSGHAVAQERQVADAIGQMGGQALHAARLAFTHPATGEPLDFSAPLPADFDHLLATMRAAYP
jgi:23S rRNA pseudouridine1911/1915/1917 synthase